MPRLQRTSRILEKAQVQLLKLRSIDPNMNFGNDRSIALLEQQISELNAELIDYNNTIASLDPKKQSVDEREKMISHHLDQLMLSIAGKYGNDSREFEMAGGMRKSDRIRRMSQGRAKSNAEKQIIPTNS